MIEVVCSDDCTFTVIVRDDNMGKLFVFEVGVEFEWSLQVLWKIRWIIIYTASPKLTLFERDEIEPLPKLFDPPLTASNEGMTASFYCQVTFPTLESRFSVERINCHILGFCRRDEESSLSKAAKLGRCGVFVRRGHCGNVFSLLSHVMVTGNAY